MHNQPGEPSPVFVDRTGRRRRLTVIAGAAMGLGLLVSVGLIIAGLFIDSSVPLPGWSDEGAPAPVEAELEGQDGLGGSPPAGTTPSSVTSIPVPDRPATSPTSASATTAPPAPQPTTSDQPGQGDDRRTAKPSRSPGKPG